VERMSLADVRAATYKPKDSWWTVFLVDPYASRLVRAVAGFRWVTPNRLTVLGTVLGLGSAACFALADRWWLLAGVVLFHLSFVVDCMDGKLARLQDSGSIFGVWLDYIIDRFKVLTCGVALMGGLYRDTDRMVYLWLAFGVVVLDMFHYLDLLRISQVKRQMRRQLAEAREAREERELWEAATAGTVRQQREEERPAVGYGQSRELKARSGRYAQIRNFLLQNRIRPNVVSGVEFQMAIFIVAPLIGPAAVIPVTLLAIGALLSFELLSIYRLWLAAKAFGRQLAALTPPAAEALNPTLDALDRAAAG
jgi:phosphatidylglycerophosphate synthase